MEVSCGDGRYSESVSVGVRRGDGRYSVSSTKGMKKLSSAMARR